MGTDDLTALVADINTQMSLIESVADRLEERVQGMQPDDAAKMESVAYQLHMPLTAIGVVKVAVKGVARHLVIEAQ